MLFERLKGVVRIGARVFIVEAGYVADGKQRIADAIKSARAAVFFCRQRIAERVNDLALRDPSGGDTPKAP